MIHFDFDQRYQDENVVGTAITRRDGVLLSVIFHGLVAAAFIVGPWLPIFQPSPEELQRRQAELERQREEASRRLVFVQPRVDIPALQPPDRADLSDLDRRAQGPVIADDPDNSLPFSRGNSTERVEAVEGARARGADDPTPPEEPQPESQLARVLPPSESGVQRPIESAPKPRVGGSLGEALQNLQRYVENQTFNNPRGTSDGLDATVQFDTRGVDFGSWWRRFRAQIRRNAFIPQAAMVLHGTVVLQMTIHRNGEITDLVIVQPSAVEAFNNTAYGALYSSNPAPPLPPEYPLEKIEKFTLIALFNEDLPN